jgi:hypothetical protein
VLEEFRVRRRTQLCMESWFLVCAGRRYHFPRLWALYQEGVVLMRFEGFAFGALG